MGTELVKKDQLEASQSLHFHVNGNERLTIANNGNASFTGTITTDNGSHYVKEKANAAGDSAGYGQLWVKNATPNELYFTTDAGDDIQLTSGTSTAGGGGGSVDADTNLANNPVWTVTSTSGIGLYIVRDKDDANSDKEVVRIRDDNADTDRPALWLISDGGAQMGTNASGITPTCAISAGYQGTTWPLHIQNGSNVSGTPRPAVGLKWKLSGWGNQDESDKWSGILVSSQANYGVKHKMDFYLQADSSASGGVNSPVVAMTIDYDLEIDGNFNDTSDIALKSNIISIPNGLDMIEKLNPVTFNWDRHGNNKPSAGFIAQEVEEVLPDLVRGEEGEKTIKTAGIVGYLVKAVQELSARVKELEG